MNNNYHIMHPPEGYGMTFELYDGNGNDLGTLFISPSMTLFSGTIKFIQSNNGKIYGEDKVFTCVPEQESETEQQEKEYNHMFELDNDDARAIEQEMLKDSYPTIDPEHFM